MNDVLIDKNGFILDPKIPRYEKLKCKTIFENSSGTTSTITLSQELQNSDKIRIYFNNGSLHDSIVVSEPINKRVSLSLMTTDGNLYVQIAEVQITATTITFSKNIEWWHSTASDGGYNANRNMVKITKVELIS